MNDLIIDKLDVHLTLRNCIHILQKTVYKNCSFIDIFLALYVCVIECKKDARLVNPINLIKLTDGAFQKSEHRLPVFFVVTCQILAEYAKHVLDRVDLQVLINGKTVP